MKRHFLMSLLAVVILSGCGSTKYAVDQTLAQKREFGPNSRETEAEHVDIVLANTDDWIKRNMW